MQLYRPTIRQELKADGVVSYGAHATKTYRKVHIEKKKLKHPGTLTLKAVRQSARMSKITNDGLTRSNTGCFIVAPNVNSVRQRVKSKLHSERVQQRTLRPECRVLWLATCILTNPNVSICLQYLRHHWWRTMSTRA